MYNCDESFLRGLHFDNEERRIEIINSLLKVNSPGRVKVLVLADLHLKGGAGQQFEDRLENARKWFGWESGRKEWDALVVAGDVVAGKEIGWQGTEDAVLLAECHDKLENIHADAGARISSSAPALAIPGNHDVVRRGGSDQRRKQTSQMLTAKNLHQSSSFVKHIQAPLAGKASMDAAALCKTPKLLLLGSRLGVIAIIGLDSNQLAYEAPGLEYPGYIGNAQLENAKELTIKLKKVFQDRPLFLWTVWHHHLLPVYNAERVNYIIPNTKSKDPNPNELLGLFDAVTIDGRTIVEELCDWRVSLATHGHMHTPCIQRISYTPHTERILNILACPSCLPKTDNEHPYVGATLVEIDLERGLAEISINGRRNVGSGIGTSQHDLHITFPIPLVSASRIPLGEMRLYRRLNAWLGRGGPDSRFFEMFPKDLPRPVLSENSRRQGDWESGIQDCLSSTGYVPACIGAPQEVIKQGMLTREQIASLPRKKYRLLLLLNENSEQSYDILLNNFFPLRLPTYGSWDAPLLPAFKTVHGLVSSWLMDVQRRLDEYRRAEHEGSRVADEITRLETILGQLATMHDGDEELVTISTRQFIKFSPTDGTPTLYDYSLTHWPLLSSNKNLDLLQFLRRGEYVRRIGSDEIRETSFRDYPRGLVWLPLSLWHQSAAIKSRNGDVMKWIEETIDELRKTSRDLPGWLLLGSKDRLKLGLTQVEQRPFGNGHGGRHTTDSNPADGPDSLVSGIDNVLTNSKEDCHIYRGQAIRMGRLRLDARYPHGRIGVSVYFAGSDGGEVYAGRLRPVQRYVLTQGLRRAEDLRTTVNAALARLRGVEGAVADIADLGMTKEAGYLRVTTPGGRVLSVLPLIIERVAAADQEGEMAEFVLCDGNHRLVQYLMIDKCEAVGCAIVDGEPKQPYYAWPYSWMDWNIVLQNQLATTPDLYSKYTPRYPTGTTFEDIKNNPESYRQYFRDFNTGFCDIGTQGGRLG